MTNIVANYTSASQTARVLTEAWVGENMPCPACGGLLDQTPNNTRACDFRCATCRDPFELKSKKSALRNLVPDGAYDSMIGAIRDNRAPNLFLLQYKLPFSVINLSVLPKRFLIEPMVVRRKPLAVTARRAGWVGCNLDLSMVSLHALIPCIVDGALLDQANVRAQWARTAPLEGLESAARGWAAVALGCIFRIGQRDFTLDDVYRFEQIAARAYPNNRNVRAKLRQQLQVLRDMGIVVFNGRGHYSLRPISDRKDQ